MSLFLLKDIFKEAKLIKEQNNTTSRPNRIIFPHSPASFGRPVNMTSANRTITAQTMLPDITCFLFLR